MVSIVIVNYNGWKDTCELITSLKQFETYSYEVIVVDNASSGDDVKQMHQVHPDINVICSELNLGFAGGNNLGYQHAKGEYIFFLNNDTIIEAPILGSLVRRLQYPAVGGVSPMIRYYDPPHDVQYYGHQKMTHITLKHATPPYDRHHPEKYISAREVEVMHGAAMMLPRKVIETVGLMAECYFLFYEEFDWSYRIIDKGFHIWYEPASLVYHKEGTKKGKLLVPFREYYLVRGRVLFARRNLRGVDKILSCIYLIGIVMPRLVLRYLLRGRWKSLWAVISGSFNGLFVDKSDLLK